MRYLDTARTGEPTYIRALDLHYDSDQLPQQFAAGDTLICGPFHANDWAWLPPYVSIEVVPDGTEVKRMKPMEWALRRRSLPITYLKKPPQPKTLKSRQMTHPHN